VLYFHALLLLVIVRQFCAHSKRPAQVFGVGHFLLHGNHMMLFFESGDNIPRPDVVLCTVRG